MKLKKGTEDRLQVTEDRGQITEAPSYNIKALAGGCLEERFTIQQKRTKIKKTCLLKA
jgi:hypothetical protein